MQTVRVEHLADGGLAARFQAMASPCEVLVDGADENELAELGLLAARECWRIQAKWSRYQAGNIVDAINSAAGQTIEVDEETAGLIEFAAQLHAGSEGRFDLTAGLLRRVWSFREGATVPDPAAVEALLPHIGWHRVVWQAPALRMLPGMELDFGGVGKEYAVDRALALLSQATSRPALVNLGGDLAANRARSDGSCWRIGIDSGVDRTATPLIRLTRGAVATSGDHHRYITLGGRRYGHVIDPRTGWPPPQAPRSVTVAGASCSEAGALTTIAILYGADAGDWLRSQQVDFHVVT
ncbi:MAG: FAD:protein FMN transferase [Nevskia sp.]|nr:FAD:protein FMN transferase [Nevskia sp.]